jgi:hypothetical protein
MAVPPLMTEISDHHEDDKLQSISVVFKPFEKKTQIMDSQQAKDLQSRALMDKSEKDIEGTLKLMGFDDEEMDLEIGVNMVDLQILLVNMLQDVLSLRGSNVKLSKVVSMSIKPKVHDLQNFTLLMEVFGSLPSTKDILPSTIYTLFQ